MFSCLFCHNSMLVVITKYIHALHAFGPHSIVDTSRIKYNLIESQLYINGSPLILFLSIVSLNLVPSQ